MGLVREVTGARMYAFYKAPDQAQRQGLLARVRGFLTQWQYSGKPGHVFRRLYIRRGACCSALHLASCGCAQRCHDVDDAGNLTVSLQ